MNPDELLRIIQQEERNKTRGRLKIFFGYAAGVGKTYAMLKAAHTAKRRGIDVVVGYIEPHTRPQTTALISGLEKIPTKKITYNHILLQEFDIDAAIQRKPKLILVDELAHTNAEGSRHAKRYQDIEELLNAGIDVYTTVNVQHIESLNDIVASITGIIVQERIPDSIFDNADQVKLIDIEPQELIQRFNAGKIYKQEQTRQALTNFFHTDNLIALREIALRRCADRMNNLSENARIKNNSDYYTDEHILVCLSSSPTNSKIIRNAARMAKAFRGGFTALFVETPDFSAMEEEDRNRLRANIHLAEQLGATIETTYGDDIAFQISEFARLSGVSKIVVGRNNAKRRFFFGKPSLTEKLTAYAPNLDIYIIPDKEITIYHKRKRKSRHPFLTSDLLKAIIIMLLSTAAGLLFYKLGFSEANIITIYILGVLFTSIATTQRIYSFISSFVSVLIYNFFFTEPRFTFNAYDAGYPVTFLIMFIAAFITSSLAVKLKRHAKQSAQTAYRTKVLFDTNQLLQQAKGKNNIISVMANQLLKLLSRSIVCYIAEGDRLSRPVVFSNSETNDDIISENEKAVAAWVYKNNKHAGATTDTLSNAKCLYLSIRVNHNVYGVVGIVIDSSPLETFENSIVLSILGECALSLEREEMEREKEETAVLAKNEQLRANLLRSISHDLRTPLTSISGNAGILLSNGDSIQDTKKKQLYNDIYDDSLWLINLVENLLSVTKIEDGSMRLNITVELVSEVITEALKHINRKSSSYMITVKQENDLLLAKMDAHLIMQVIINIVDNAIKYTPPGSKITITTKKQGNKAVISIADTGPGLSDEEKTKIFNMFYTTSNKADGHRGLGLGLALCKSIITAHNGEIYVFDNKPTGSVFEFTLPVEEVTIHE